MKFSNDLISILKNFANTSNVIHIKKGNVLTVLSSSEHFYGKATVVEEFPHPVLLYDVMKFLGIIGLLPNAEIEIGEHSLTMKSGSNTIEFLYSEAFLVPETPTVRLNPDNHCLKCTLTNTVLETAQRAALLFSAKTVSITGDGETAKLIVGNTSIANRTDNYQHVIGPCTETFNYLFTLDKLKIIPDTYEVVMGSRGTGDEAMGIMHMKGKLAEYWIVCDPESTL